jgi:hypothetical protein
VELAQTSRDFLKNWYKFRKQITDFSENYCKAENFLNTIVVAVSLFVVNESHVLTTRPSTTWECKIPYA